MRGWISERRWMAVSAGLVLALLLLLLILPTSRVFAASLLNRLRGEPSLAEYDVVVYGGSFSGYSAVRSIQKENPSARVLILVPQRQLGEIGTVAAMNFWDLRGYDRGWIGGSFKELFEKFDRAYDPDEMSAFMAEQLAFDPNIEIHYGVDLRSAKVVDGEVKEVQFQGLNQLPDGREVFDPNDPPSRVEARVFIDASYNGRLLRLAGFQGVTGREAYAEKRQQAVTLLFEIEGLDYWKAVASKDFLSNVDKDGSRMLWGGDPGKHQKTWAFNNGLREKGRLKPLNLAEGMRDRYWVNVLLMYGVDATKEDKDKGTPLYPENNLMSVDEGYQAARRIVESDEFLEAIRDFPGFADVHITRFAPMLYVRESVHSCLYPKPGEFGFAVLGDHVGRAGVQGDEGADGDSMPSRVGLQFYFLDTQGYLDVDPFEKEMEDESKLPTQNPCYLPYAALTNPALKNVLVCGYGINVSSIAWYSLRVLPNQMVAGDAAGAAAIEAIESQKNPGAFGPADIAAVQARLRRVGAVLDKKVIPYRVPLSRVVVIP